MPAGRDLIDRRRLEDLLAVYDQQLARLGAQVTAARQAFVGVVQDELAAAFAAITRSDPLRRPARPHPADPRSGQASTQKVTALAIASGRRTPRAVAMYISRHPTKDSYPGWRGRLAASTTPR